MTHRKHTVLIPTRERADTLEKSIKTVLQQDYGPLEIIVSDNHSSDNTEEVVRSFRDPRLQYINPKRRLSMSENWEFALAAAQGDWITIIGDDDGLLPNCFPKLNALIDETGAQAVRTEVCSYAWPGMSGGRFGRLSVPRGRGVHVCKSRDALDQVLSGRANYPMLPMLYNGGFVSRSVLDQARDSKGIFYQSCNPDVYSAVIVAARLDRYVFSSEPLAINGASMHSTGSSHFRAAGTGAEKAKAAELFVSEGNIPFHSEMSPTVGGGCPKSIQALVFESYLQAKALVPTMPALDPSWVLRTVLATAAFPEELEEWAGSYAALHHLDLEATRVAAKRTARISLIPRIATHLTRYGEFTTVGGSDCPLGDVMEASLAASALRAAAPSWSANAIRTARARLRRSTS